ncbi:response regulator [Sneathiella sp. HT1-7]|jgi:DNA-binding response OmpR family regulator|uniref:response regulator n=1 Tax=Sneathiella sp. HT1-7 TaxID=2887192 RepID=UPI001D13341C|nr:response regulator transcription factor [Sneathiella sp. HT1-7]MCC3306408.1 response regulator transcription factor [Sneathiella sp. HT1-7]
MNKGAVLLIDDDEGLRTVLSHYFEAEGYSVITAKDGAEVSNKLAAEQLDVILLDLVLPDTEGTSLIPVIRQSTSAPIIVVSGKNDTTEKIICLEMGADDYLTKPFELRELKARIKAAMRRANEHKADPAAVSETVTETEVIAFGRFTLDRDQYQVFDKDGNSVDFTIGEFQLLEALVTSPKRTLSREQLFEKTRDGKFDVYDRAIDIQIGRIRKKLGEDGPILIKTMRGVGYMYAPKS